MTQLHCLVDWQTMQQSRKLLKYFSLNSNGAMRTKWIPADLNLKAAVLLLFFSRFFMSLRGHLQR